MSVLDLAAGKVTQKIAVGGEPEGVTLRPDGKVVYVTSEQDNQVVAIDTKKLAVVARIPTGPRPRAIAFSRDSKTGFVDLREQRRRHRVRRRQEQPVGDDQDRAGRQDRARPAPDGRRAVARRQDALRLERSRRIGRRHRHRRPQGRAPDRRGRRAPVGHRGRPPTAKRSTRPTARRTTCRSSTSPPARWRSAIKVGGLPWGIAMRPMAGDGPAAANVSRFFDQTDRHPASPASSAMLIRLCS